MDLQGLAKLSICMHSKYNISLRAVVLMWKGEADLSRAVAVREGMQRERLKSSEGLRCDC